MTTMSIGTETYAGSQNETAWHEDEHTRENVYSSAYILMYVGQLLSVVVIVVGIASG